MALCLHFSLGNDRPVTSLNSNFVSGTTPMSFHVSRTRRKSNYITYVSFSVSCSSIKLVRDRSLDRHVVKKNKIRFVQKMMTLLLSKPKHYLPLHIISKCRSYLNLYKPHSLISMIHRYPSILELFTIPYPLTPLNATKSYPQLCVRLTPTAAALAAEELSVKNAISTTLATKLQKLLMLSSHHQLLLSKLVHLALDLGLPPNFRSRLCNDHPDRFKTVDTTYGHALELVSCDSSLAKPLSSPTFYSHDLIVDRPLRFKQVRLRKGLNVKRRHHDFLIKFEEIPKICPYRTPMGSLEKESIEAEKRSCAVVREVLGMMVEKRTLIDHLTHFRKEFGLPNKLRGMILRHPELFYVSLKGQRDSVFLVEKFDEKGDLLEKDKILLLQDQWMKLARESKRMRRERRRLRINKYVGGFGDTNDHDSDEEDDDDDDYDNFKNGFDDGFEDLFEDLDFDDNDDNNHIVQNRNGEFWIARSLSVQDGLDGAQEVQPW